MAYRKKSSSRGKRRSSATGYKKRKSAASKKRNTIKARTRPSTVKVIVENAAANPVARPFGIADAFQIPTKEGRARL